MMEIRTNNVPRFTLDAYELTAKEREEFDYLDWEAIDAGNDSATFFRYKGQLYCLSEVLRIDEYLPSLQGWDGYTNDSFSSGLVVKLMGDGDRIIVGQYFS